MAVPLLCGREMRAPPLGSEGYDWLRGLLAGVRMHLPGHPTGPAIAGILSFACSAVTGHRVARATRRQVAHAYTPGGRNPDSAFEAEFRPRRRRGIRLGRRTG